MISSVLLPFLPVDAGKISRCFMVVLVSSCHFKIKLLPMSVVCVVLFGPVI
jgi:hypothetical protein